MAPKIVFRADASFSIGTGHIIRCLAFADILRNHGAECIFASNKDTLDVVPTLANSFYAVAPPEDMSKLNPDLIVIDHYGMDKKYQEQMARFSKYVAVIDDINTQEHSCDFLISQNPIAMREDYADNIPTGTIGFFGAEYLLLRKEFILKKNELPIRKSPPKTLLLFFGGTDLGNLTTRILNIFKQIQNRPKLIVVVGAGNPYKDEITPLCTALDAELHFQTQQMDQLMLRADMAIGCGGTAIWERLSLGLPTLEITHSDFQIPTLKQLHNAGYLYYLGDNRILSDEQIRETIEKKLKVGLSIKACKCGTQIENMALEILQKVNG